MSSVAVNKEIDPDFAKLLRKSQESGVKVLCYASRYDRNKVTLEHELVNLET